MTAYYNEFDPFCAKWLRNLIAAGLIAPGEVDERSILDVRADDVRGYRQCHFFAGIGVWSCALRLAGWPDDRPAWTGSCPCQPFSDAGAKLGTADERHLWPEFFRLIRECRPPIVIGEQVASKTALGWLDLVFDDLEGAGYACGAADTCAAGVGAPHIRQRLYWVANSEGFGREQRWQQRRGLCQASSAGESDGGRNGALDRVANAEARGQRIDGSTQGESRHATQREPACGLGDSDEARLGVIGGRGVREDRDASHRTDADGPGALGFASARDRYRFERLSGHGLAGFWADAEWLRCRPEPKYPEGRWRPVEPGTQQMVDGFAESLGRLRPGLIDALTEEIDDAELPERDVREALRNLWIANAEAALQRTPGRCRSIREAPILLAFMRELSRARWDLVNHLPPSCWESAEAGLREMRATTPETPCPSSGRESGEQRARQPADAVPVVSQAIAHAIEGAWAMPHPLAHGSPARVGRLRAYGNALCAPQAAGFVRCLLSIVRTAPAKERAA